VLIYTYVAWKRRRTNTDTRTCVICFRLVLTAAPDQGLSACYIMKCVDFWAVSEKVDELSLHAKVPRAAQRTVK